MIWGSGTDTVIFLWGRTCPPLMYVSSFTMTSSPRTVVPSIRTHFPTEHLHPTMQLSSHEFDLMTASVKIVDLFTHTPSSMTTPGPMVTFGPIWQLGPILAVGSTRTLPTTPGPLYSWSEFFERKSFRYRHMPVRKSLGWPTSIQKPCSSKAYSWWSQTISGKTSFSIDVGRSWILLTTLGFRMYRPERTNCSYTKFRQ